MNIAILGNDTAFNEAKAKLGERHQYFHAELINREVISSVPDVVFDFNTEWSQASAQVYKTLTAPLFLNTLLTTLAATKKQMPTGGVIIGFCGLPTFFNRNRLEVVISNEPDRTPLENILHSLNFDFTVAKDQVGMVTPRVVCMIINEAYDALQQGVASRADIDLSMKMGTNYPFGPFEWAEKIGLENVRKLLLGLQAATHDPRFNPNF